MGIETSCGYQIYFKDTPTLCARVDDYRKYFTLNDSSQQIVDQVFLGIGQANTLDVGCSIGIPLFPLGPNLIDTPAMIGADKSYRMLHYVKNHATPSAQLAQIDAQNLPFPDDSFGNVLYRHMLYHVPNIQQAITEGKRVLRPGGYLIATANEMNGKPELKALHYATLQEVAPESYEIPVTSRFGAENGECILRDVFSNVVALPWRGIFHFTDIHPAIRFYTQTGLFLQTKIEADLQDQFLQKMSERMEEIIKQRGSIDIPQEGKIFIATK